MGLGDTLSETLENIFDEIYDEEGQSWGICDPEWIQTDLIPLMEVIDRFRHTLDTGVMTDLDDRLTCCGQTFANVLQRLYHEHFQCSPTWPNTADCHNGDTGAGRGGGYSGDL